MHLRRIVLVAALVGAGLVGTAAPAHAATSLSITLRVDDPAGTRYFWGDEIPFAIRIENTGTTDIHGLAISIPGGECEDLSTTVFSPGDWDERRCMVPTTHDHVGTYTTTGTVTSTELPPIVSAARSAVVRPGAALRAVLQSDKARYVLGEEIDYTIRLYNRAHHATLSGIYDSFTDGDCVGLLTPILLPGEDDIDTCTRTTSVADLGTTHHEVGAGSEQTGAIPPGELDLFVGLRPDARIRRGSGPFVGDGVYNRTGAGQTRSAGVGPNVTTTFTIEVQNDSPEAEDLRVRGAGASGSYLVTYRRQGVAVTGQVTGAGLVLQDVPPGGSRTLALVIKPRPGAARGARIERFVTVTSTTTPSVKDTVKATVVRG